MQSNQLSVSDNDQDDVDEQVYLNSGEDNEEQDVDQDLEKLPSRDGSVDDPHKEIKQQLSKGLQNIKSHLSERKKLYKSKLKERISVIEKNEKELKNVSANFGYMWKKIQNKTLFLSLLRKILRNARNFGIDPKKLPEMAKLDEEIKTKNSWVIYPDSSLYKFHIIVMSVIMIYLIIFFPLDLAFNIDDSSPQWGIAD